jgi:large subunit ribosomal protein L25
VIDDRSGVISVSESKLTATPRSEFGKGAARRLRRARQVPAVLYGHGTDPVHIALPGHETMLALKQANVLLEIAIEGGSKALALPKDIQRNPLRDEIEHVDLLVVRRGEKVTVDVHVQIVGDTISGTLVTSELTALSIEVEATKIPGSIELDLAGAAAGTQILAGQIALPEGAVLLTDPEAVVAQVTDATRPTADEAADEAAAAAESVSAPA